MNNYIVIFIIIIILLTTCLKFKEKFDEYESINHPIDNQNITYNNINATNEATLESEIAGQSGIIYESNTEHVMNDSQSDNDKLQSDSSPLVNAGINDVNNKMIGVKPFANDGDIEDYNQYSQYPNTELIQKDMICAGLTKQECKQKVVNISDSDINDAVRNQPLNINRYRFTKQYHLPDTKPYFHGKQGYSADEVNVTGNISYYNPITGESISDDKGHIWTSNNIDDNFNKIDEKQFMKPLIIQSNVKGVSNIFAPVIYIKDGKQLPYDYVMNNNKINNNVMNNNVMNNNVMNNTINLGNDDLLGDNNIIMEMDNNVGLFEKDNIIIPK